MSPLANIGCAVRAAAAAAVLLAAALPAQAATRIERVVSPGGIEAWLVRDKSVPLVAMNFAFRGGANQDPEARPGVAYMTAALLDEGAGDLDARAFAEKIESNAVEMQFGARRDEVSGSLRVLRDRLDVGVDLLRLALGAPRFDPEPVERVRAQMLAALRRETTDPNNLASRLWWRTAFPAHPYGRPSNGTLESVPLITREDVADYARRVFARDQLKVAVVGDIEPEAVGALLDRVFGGLPEKAKLTAIGTAAMQGAGRRLYIDLKVPQAVLSFGGNGIARKDPDFIPAYIVNHILGGGSFSSRLYREVREKRGLVYSVYSYLLPLDRAALMMGGTQTRADRTDETLDLIEAEARRMRDAGPTAEELDKAKSYLRGSYALNFDTSTKIAAQLVQLQLDDLGIDYIERRNAMIDKVTIEDVRRAAQRLLDTGMLFTVVGRAGGEPVKKEGG